MLLKTGERQVSKSMRIRCYRICRCSTTAADCCVHYGWCARCDIGKCWDFPTSIIQVMCSGTLLPIQSKLLVIILEYQQEYQNIHMLLHATCLQFAPCRHMKTCIRQVVMRLVANRNKHKTKKKNVTASLLNCTPTNYNIRMVQKVL